jgi:arylsulfatase A-like enzyme
MNRLVFLLCFPTLGIPLVTGAETRPNVLFIMVDDLRPELGCYGSTHVRSPRIDEVASRGLVLERAYCQQAHCRPSRFSLLSGCRPDTAGIWTNQDVRPALADKPFLPAHFRRHGYYCIGLGKIAHNNQEDPACWSEPHRMPPNYSFEYRTRAGRALVAKMQREASAAGLPDPFADVPENIRRGRPYEILDVSDSELGDGQLADEAIAALESLAGRPFFLGVGFLRPHLPFVAPKRYWDLYDPAVLPAVDPHATHEGLPGLSANDSRELRMQYRGVPVKGAFPDRLNRKLWHGYLACVSFVDAQIGRILDALDRLDLASNTIIVIAGDHGFHLGEIGLWCKATNFEAATRTVLVIYAPGMKAGGAKTCSLVELLGLYPTLCDLAGLPKPDHLQGDSFAVLLDDPSLQPVDAAFSQYPRGSNMGRAIRTPRYRLIEWRHRDSGELLGRELYDHESDPDETTNLAGRSEYIELIEPLSARLQAARLPSLGEP